MRHGFVLFVAAVIVGSASLGCCCKKGLVLRGDWSLELNRVPHMATNGPQYQPECVDCVCYEEACGCAGGCTAEGCAGGSACRSQGGGGYASSSYGGPGFAGGALTDEHEPPHPTAAAQTRFHPVPTHPVFERQVEMVAPTPPQEWAPAARSKSQPTR